MPNTFALVLLFLLGLLVLVGVIQVIQYLFTRKIESAENSVKGLGRVFFFGLCMLLLGIFLGTMPFVAHRASTWWGYSLLNETQRPDADQIKFDSTNSVLSFAQSPPEGWKIAIEPFGLGKQYRVYVEDGKYIVPPGTKSVLVYWVGGGNTISEAVPVCIAK